LAGIPSVVVHPAALLTIFQQASGQFLARRGSQ